MVGGPKEFAGTNGIWGDQRYFLRGHQIIILSPHSIYGEWDQSLFCPPKIIVFPSNSKSLFCPLKLRFWVQKLFWSPQFLGLVGTKTVFIMS